MNGELRLHRNQVFYNTRLARFMIQLHPALATMTRIGTQVTTLVMLSWLAACGQSSTPTTLSLDPTDTPGDAIATDADAATIQGSVQSSTATFTAPVTTDYAGTLRLDVEVSDPGTLPNTLSVGAANFVQMSHTVVPGFVSFAVDLETVFTPLDPFQTLPLALPDGTTVQAAPIGQFSDAVELIYQGNPTTLDITDVAVVLAALQIESTDANAIADRANTLLDATGVNAQALDPVPDDTNTNFIDAGTGVLNLLDVAAVLARIQVGTNDVDAVATRINELLDTPSAVQTEDVVFVPGTVIPQAANGSIDLNLKGEVGGFTAPLYLTHAGDDRLFVVEQGGQIKIVQNGSVLPTPFLDVTAKTNAGGEQGLLSIAFPSDYATSGYFVINYTDQQGDSVVSRFTVSGDPNVANTTEEILLTVDQPFSNHNGGLLKFGPDGFLYVALGDGGSGGDPGNRAQTGGTLLGKLLRIQVDATGPYTVPGSNPFVGDAGVLDEIWALGLRNSWRFSFDRGTGDLFIGDVGQGSFEEINRQPAASPGGENYGWRITEGDSCFNPPIFCDRTGLTPPIITYGRALGQSVTGGYVYRGSRYPDMVGTYFYGDFVSGRVWGAQGSGNNWTSSILLENAAAISSFGEDVQGELYLVDYTGRIFEVADDPTP